MTNQNLFIALGVLVLALILVVVGLASVLVLLIGRFAWSLLLDWWAFFK